MNGPITSQVTPQIKPQVSPEESSQKSSQWQPQPLTTEARTLPAELYTSPDVYELEKKRIFGTCWFYAGHISQLQGAGSYFTIDIAEQPIVILQTKTGELRAFFNVCSHRGGPVAVDSGQATHFTCLYHAWSFDLDGNLKGAPEMTTAQNFDCSSHGLTAVSVDTWGPFIFINLDPNCKPLSFQLENVPELFKAYRFSELFKAYSVDYWADANWKVFSEMTVESYHEPFLHRATLGNYYDCLKAQGEARHYYYLQFVPLLESEWTPEAQSGLYIDHLGEYEQRHFQMVSLFPNFTLLMAPNYCMTFLIDPQGTTKTRIQVDLLVPDTEVAKSPENVELLMQFFDELMQEDLRLLPRLQKGIQSLGFHTGRLCPSREMGVHLFQELVMKHLLQ